jgi:hypothetical protein
VNLPCAVTPSQVVIKKLLNYLLVDAMDGESALGRPVSKVGNATEVGINGVRCVASLSQVMRESINVGHQLAIKKPGCRVMVGIHYDLLKWVDFHFRTRAKLCQANGNMPCL